MFWPAAIFTCMMLAEGSPTGRIQDNAIINLGNSATQERLRNLAGQFNVSFGISTATTAQAQLLFKMNSYCSCMCCQEAIPSHLDSTNNCDRNHPVQLPSTFTCPSDYCKSGKSNDCKEWDQNKCNQACFCRRCKSRVGTNDPRCRGSSANLIPGPRCECSAIRFPPPCLPESRNLHDLWLQLLLLLQQPGKKDCLFGCFCNRCNKADIGQIIPSVYKTCRSYTTIPATNCVCPSCPSRPDAINAEEIINSLKVSSGAHGK